MCNVKIRYQFIKEKRKQLDHIKVFYQKRSPEQVVKNKYLMTLVPWQVMKYNILIYQYVTDDNIILNKW